MRVWSRVWNFHARFGWEQQFVECMLMSSDQFVIDRFLVVCILVARRSEHRNDRIAVDLRCLHGASVYEHLIWPIVPAEQTSCIQASTTMWSII